MTRRFSPRVCRGCGLLFEPATALTRYGAADCKRSRFVHKSRAVPGGRLSHRHPKRGTCTVCGCTHERPCMTETAGPCGWANRERTLCTGCVKP